MTLADLIERNALLHAGHPALLCDGSSLSYAEFAARARRLASALASRGLHRGDRVGVLAQNCPEYIEAYAACQLAGFITVGLNYRLSAPEQAAILNDCEPAALIYQAQYVERVQELRGALGHARLLCIGDDYEAALAKAELRVLERPTREDVACLVYTSGTTGQPKGVMLTHGGLVDLAQIHTIACCASPVDRLLIVMPYYHVGAVITSLTWVVVGATVVLHRAFDARAVLESIERDRATAAHLAPVMIQAMLDVPELARFDRSSLQTVVYASSPMLVAQLRRAIAAFGPIFMQVYGMTESGVATVLQKHQHVLDGSPVEVGRLASAGQPMLGSEVKIVHSSGRQCAVGEVGEIWGYCPGVMSGYWRKPEASAEVLVDGWLKTGDMGYVDAEAYVFVVDRKKDMIVSGGENIYSREVEEALMLHPAVLEAAVIGVPDDKWGEAVKAFVVFKPGHEASEVELIEHCRSLIAGYKKPKSIEALAVLPRLATNKIDKKKLREPYWAERERRV